MGGEGGGYRSAYISGDVVGDVEGARGTGVKATRWRGSRGQSREQVSELLGPFWGWGGVVGGGGIHHRAVGMDSVPPPVSPPAKRTISNLSHQ